MKKVLRAASIALLTASVGSAAQAADLLLDPPPPPHQPEEVSYGSGFIQGKVGTSSDQDGDPTKDKTIWSLRGTHAVNLGNGFNVQGDLEYKIRNGDCCDDSTFAGTGHVFLRDSQSYAVGAYGHLSYLDDGANKQEEVYHFGLEGAVFMGSFTALGAIGTGTVHTTNNEFDNTAGKIEGRYYVTPNLRFDATLAMDETKLINAKESTTQFGLRANWRMEDVPVTLIAGYRHEQQDLQVGTLKLDPARNDTFYVSARFSWGSKSLKDEERNGALWDPNTRIGN